MNDPNKLIENLIKAFEAQDDWTQLEMFHRALARAIMQGGVDSEAQRADLSDKLVTCAMNTAVAVVLKRLAKLIITDFKTRTTTDGSTDVTISIDKFVDYYDGFTVRARKHLGHLNNLIQLLEVPPRQQTGTRH